MNHLRDFEKELYGRGGTGIAGLRGEDDMEAFGCVSVGSLMRSDPFGSGSPETCFSANVFDMIEGHRTVWRQQQVST